MPRGYWTCQRVSGGERCGYVNANRQQLCGWCGKRRAARKRPVHKAVLGELDYQAFIELNGGEHCAICGAGPGSRRLHRDHDHKTGKPRGLLCFRCNTALPTRLDAAWLRAAADYLFQSLPERTP